MLILLGFALLAGAGTALSPCVLPVLPALLSAGGDRRPAAAARDRARPVGHVHGHDRRASPRSSTASGSARTRCACSRSSCCGVRARAAAARRRRAPRGAARRACRGSGPRTRGDGFASGLLVGAALGFVYTPCAGPILAAVISVSAASGRSIAVALAYAAGSALVLLALCARRPARARPRPARRARAARAARARAS